MRITCPGCTAEYEVPSSSLHPRRKVRCTRCGTEWVPVQDALPVQPPDPLLSAADAGMAPAGALNGPSAMDRLAAMAPPQPSVGLKAAWVLTVLVLAGSAAAAMTWRDQVTRAWPASAWILGAADQVVPAPAQPARTGMKPEKSSD